MESHIDHISLRQADCAQFETGLVVPDLRKQRTVEPRDAIRSNVGEYLAGYWLLLVAGATGARPDAALRVRLKAGNEVGDDRPTLQYSRVQCVPFSTRSPPAGCRPLQIIGTMGGAVALSWQPTVSWSTTMHSQIIMDRHGDTRHEFDPADATSVGDAEVRFRELTGKGFRAVAFGEAAAARQGPPFFRSDVRETLFIPQLQGG